MSKLFFDTHLHLGPEDDAPALLAEARAVGVGRFLIAAGNLADAGRAGALAATATDVAGSAGVHPHEAAAFAGDMAPFRALLHEPNMVAVGEIGLDYHYRHSPDDVQRRVFREFLQLAVQEKLPAIVHCRDAFDDCCNILRDVLPHGHPFEIHSFTGTPAQAEAVLAMGGFLAFNGMVTFKKADNIRAALAVVPLERLLIETDSPYLAPVPHRGRPNRPAYVVEVAKAIATCKGISLDELAGATMRNGVMLFGGNPHEQTACA